MRKKSIETLEREHSLAENLIVFLEGISRNLREKKAVSFIKIGEMIEAAETFLLGHHKKEMELFSLLSKKEGVSKKELISILLREHDLGSEYVKNVLKIIGQKGRGRKEKYELLPFHLERYSRMLLDHIKKEEEDLFPLARKIVSGDQEEELEKNYQKISFQPEFRKAFDLISRIKI